MNTVKFEFDGKEHHLVAKKKIGELDISEDELLTLWSFNNHVDRLIGFVRSFYREIRISYAMPSSKKKTKDKNIPTELRLSAAINELRPFMLNNDSINFYNVRKIICKQLQNNVEFRECMRWYKKFWDSYDINKNHDSAVKMGTRYNINKVSITTYSELLRVFMYGKYIHNNDNPKNTAIVYRIESSYYYSSIRAELGVCIADICDILRIFNRNFVKPILEIYKGTIKNLNWQSINKLELK